ncbi:MAG: two-component regulator propeller domain-containing protein [Candidatus Cyclobacteriaceae bacterium M3_2C_046]
MKKYFLFVLGVFHLSFSYGQTWEFHLQANGSSIPSNQVTSVNSDKNGKIWISTLSGIASYDTLWYVHKPQNALYGESILNVWTEEGNVWIGTEFEGLWQYDGISIWLISAIIYFLRIRKELL